ncbi:MULTISPECIES: hypothetical protein [unclassified Paenibacillus]|uniref:hypothetical protein n=1 Tax=unclassified Paenibacillus TaxID=185978 RepID=UPI000919263D|nr:MULTISPECIES: hypothetical protein [unclassified Paenibacillus]SHN81942.1 hypothetical protein SAMN04487896_4897 [Paenibacillus sp. ov031]SLJ91584.1 hypothetical protein SAMN06272722_101858 [Paenibacillus sp. RU5A]SOC58789.1 hypothetical protein SAMN05880581_101332 [Paenibacillus sp. RU26A]SOC67841.1 hypothetical protein SAMN05880586_101332 [Paenibacillus sp. RU5M]
MAYSQSKTEAVATHLRNRFMEGNVEGHEIVVALISMVKAQKINIDDVAPVLFNVFFDNPEGILSALEKASTLVDDELIDSIINEVNENA